MKPKPTPLKIVFFSLMFLAFISACSQGGVATQVEDQSADLSQSTEANPQDPASIQLDWEAGPHADTFVVSGDDTNDTCARCHAPIVWVPSVEDMPESCSSCKFDVEQPPPYMPPEEWRPIECHVCHQADGDEIDPEIAWLEIAQIEEYQEVASVTELCQKCHLAGEIAGHTSVTVAGDHAGYECTRCHDAHSTAASCTGEGCHDQMPEPITGHDQAHANVSCVACHDASGMEIGPNPDTAIWTTLFPSEGEDSLHAFPSHNTQVSIACDRCHFADNPWSLSEIEPAATNP
ncbi:MAG: hypothetical protein PVF49_10215 [Anaerolineales bacterium]|jgi:hypothetical protein